MLGGGHVTSASAPMQTFRMISLNADMRLECDYFQDCQTDCIVSRRAFLKRGGELIVARGAASFELARQIEAAGGNKKCGQRTS